MGESAAAARGTGATGIARLTAANDTWRNLPSLTEREHSILQQVLDGKSNKQIARDLGLSESTVKIHLQHIYQKLGVIGGSTCLWRRRDLATLRASSRRNSLLN